MKPPFTLTNSMLNKVLEISKVLGRLEVQVDRQLRLRKENRIKSIHSSLAIEQNSLSVEQVTDIIDGKRVLGNPREIREVKNAYDAYEEIMTFSPYNETDFLKAHALLTAGIVNTAGHYRSRDVGIFDEDGTVVHMGARPAFIKGLMTDLFSWGALDDTPEIIKSCVFHYEIEMIHPFEDGNGRMGRLWQTVILANWNPVFSWLPIETMIYQHQKAYYQVLAASDRANNSSPFIDFMLDIILETLKTYQSDDKEEIESESLSITNLNAKEYEMYTLVKDYLDIHEIITAKVVEEISGKSASTARKYLANFVAKGLLKAHGSNKNRHYSLK